MHTRFSRLATHIGIIPVVCALLLQGCSTPQASTDTPARSITFNIREVEKLIQAGRHDEALNGYVLPIIADFKKIYGTSKKRIYCAQKPAESLYYLLLSAGKKEEAIVIDPQYGEAYFYSGYILVEKHLPNQAKESLQKAIELAPARAHYLSELGNVYQSEGNLKKASELFDQAIEAALILEKDDKASVELRRAYRGKAFSLTDLGRYDEAEALYNKCLELFPTDEKAKYELNYIKNIRLRNSINNGKY